MPEVMIAGAAGRLEGRYKHAKLPGAPIALILHPNPQRGGTMNNKVVYSLFETFAAQGASVLRFNFRGVGRSQGEFDHGEGELGDAAAALHWLMNVNPNPSAIWVAGFSFGAWIGMQLLMRRPEIDGYISIAPPANLYDFNFLAPCPNEGLIVQGDKDQIVNPESVRKLVDRLKDQRGSEGVEYQTVAGAGHFFNNEGEIEQMEQHVRAYIAKTATAVRKAA